MGFSSSGGAKVGTIELWGGSTAPDGYLLCNGGTVSRSLYSDLFAVIGTTYGAGDGSTTFNLPNGANVVTSVNTSVSVNGDGKALGLTDGTNFGALSRAGSGDTKALFGREDGYGTAVGSTTTSTTTLENNKSVGVTTDSSKSGIVGTVTRSIMNCKYIIKY